MLKIPEFKQHVLDAHLNFILAAGLQLVFAPKQKSTAPNSTATETVSKINGEGVSSYLKHSKLEAASSENCGGDSKDEGSNPSDAVHPPRLLETRIVDSTVEQTVAADHVTQGREVLELLINCVRHDRLIRELLVLSSSVSASVKVR
jgi:hypothetical protein